MADGGGCAPQIWVSDLHEKMRLKPLKTPKNFPPAAGFHPPPKSQITHHLEAHDLGWHEKGDDAPPRHAAGLCAHTDASEHVRRPPV